jgi:hypothetical protein
MKSTSKRLIGIGILLLQGACVPLVLMWRIRTDSGGRESAERFLKDSRLGSLPAGSKNVVFRGWSGPFTGETWIRFELPPDDIEAFVAASQALSGIEPKETYDRDHPLYPFPDQFYRNGPATLAAFPPGARFHSRNASDPEWYVTTIPGKGRMYFLWPSAWVYLDEERGIVWIKVVKG